MLTLNNVWPIERTDWIIFNNLGTLWFNFHITLCLCELFSSGDFLIYKVSGPSYHVMAKDQWARVTCTAWIMCVPVHCTSILQWQTCNFNCPFPSIRPGDVSKSLPFDVGFSTNFKISRWDCPKLFGQRFQFSFSPSKECVIKRLNYP